MKRLLNHDQIKQIKQMLSESFRISDIAAMTGTSRVTIAQIKAKQIYKDD